MIAIKPAAKRVVPPQMRLPVVEWQTRRPARAWRARNAADRRRIETILAVARVILAGAAVAATLILPQLDGARPLVRALAYAYAAEAALALPLVSLQTRAMGATSLALQILDDAWATTL